jgi:hypothetical protein
VRTQNLKETVLLLTDTVRTAFKGEIRSSKEHIPYLREVSRDNKERISDDINMHTFVISKGPP